MPELVDAKGLQKDISNLNVRADMLKIDFTGLYTFADDVVVHLDMFSPCVKDGVPRQINTAHVIVVEVNWIIDMYT